MPTAPPVGVEIRGKDKISKVFSTVSAKLNKFGAGARKIGRGLSTSLTLPIALVGGVAIRAAGNFEASMKTLEGVVGDVGIPAMKKMADTAKELGATTQFSASQAAEGMTSLAKVGLNVKQVIDAVAPSLELAAAEEVELSEASAAVAFNLKRFNLEATQANRIAQLLSATASGSGTDFASMEESMVKLGPVMGKMGFQIEEVSALLGILGDGGIKGSQAGAALATSFSRLAKPTAEMSKVMDFFKISLFDATGNVKPMSQFVGELQKKLSPLNAKTRQAAISTIFGARALGQWVTVIDSGIKGFTAMEKKITGTTAATDKARLKMAGFNGAMKALKSALEAVAIAIGEAGILDFLTDMADKLANTFRILAKTNPAILRIGFVIAVAAAAIGPLLIALGLMATGIGMLAPALKILTAIQWLWNVALTANPIGLVIVAIGLLVAGVVLLIKKWDTIISKFKSGFTILKRIGTFFTGGDAGGPEMATPMAGAAGITKTVEETRRTELRKGEATLTIEGRDLPENLKFRTEAKNIDLNQDLGFVGAQ